MSAILDHANQRELLVRREAEGISAAGMSLAQVESAMADRLLDEVIREQAATLTRAADAVVDRLCEAEMGPALSAPT